MKKNILMILSIVSIVIVVFILQLFFINQKEIFGIRPNLILITCIVISLWYGVYIGGISSFLLGIMTNFLYGNNMAVYVIGYTLCGILIGSINTNYRKENKMTFVYVTVFATFLFEIVQYIGKMIMYNIDGNFWYLLKQSVISSLLNIVIVYILYYIIAKISEHMEDKIIRRSSGF